MTQEWPKPLDKSCILFSFWLKCAQDIPRHKQSGLAPRLCQLPESTEGQWAERRSSWSCSLCQGRAKLSTASKRDREDRDKAKRASLVYIFLCPLLLWTCDFWQKVLAAWGSLDKRIFRSLCTRPPTLGRTCGKLGVLLLNLVFRCFSCTSWHFGLWLWWEARSTWSGKE